MTEQKKINEINDFLKKYAELINGREIAYIDEYNIIHFQNRHRYTYTKMSIIELPYTKNVQDAIDTRLGSPRLYDDATDYYCYYHAIPYDYKYLSINPSESRSDYYLSCGIYYYKSRETSHNALPVTSFDDFNGLFAPAIEQFQFNKARKKDFLNLLDELNNIKNEQPNLFIILNHASNPIEGFFIMLLQYSDKIYLFRVTDNS